MMTSCVGNSAAWGGCSEQGTGHHSEETYVSMSMPAGTSKDQTTELFVYNEDGTAKSLSIAEGLLTCDLCELLTIKNYVARDTSWCLLECWKDPAIERIVEDSEDVLTVYRSMLSANYDAYFSFRRELSKYDFFDNPQLFFPDNMVHLPEENRPSKFSGVLERTILLQSALMSTDAMLEVHGWLWTSGPDNRVWRRAFFWLRDGDLYCCNDVSHETPALEPANFSLFARLSQQMFYSCDEARRWFRAPCDCALVLRHCTRSDDAETQCQQLCCLGCDSIGERRCWLAALRLVKYGRKLVDSLSLCRRQLETSSQCSLSMRSRGSSFSGTLSSSYSGVSTMSSSGLAGCLSRPRTSSNTGVAGERRRQGVLAPARRTVLPVAVQVSPQSTRSLMALSASFSSTSCRSDASPSVLPPSTKQCSITNGGCIEESAVHLTQPWYHDSISGDEAARLLSQSSHMDGVFLVRSSRSISGGYVLCFTSGRRVCHVQIVPQRSVSTGKHSVSLDSGHTCFYDVLQLVEFYQLNRGALPTQLTHFISNTTNSCSLPPPAATSC